MSKSRMWADMPAAVANMQKEIERLRLELQDSKHAQADCYAWIHECACAFDAVRTAVENAASTIPVPFTKEEEA